MKKNNSYTKPLLLDRGKVQLTRLLMAFIMLLAGFNQLKAQTFSYGTGLVAGNTAPFAVTNAAVTIVGNSATVIANTTMTGGTYNFVNFTINAGITVTGTGANALIIRCTGTFTNNGILKADGGLGGTFSAATGGAAGTAGPCLGKAGGAGQTGAANNTGGTGANGVPFAVATAGNGFGGNGGNNATGGGFAPTGGSYGTLGNSGFSALPGTLGVVYNNATLSTNVTGSTLSSGSYLCGGSGGGGGGACHGGAAARRGGGGGGGGGGAIQISANTITLGGASRISVRGGQGGDGSGTVSGIGGGGSGGTVNLQYFTLTGVSVNTTPTASGAGTIDIAGGRGGQAGYGSTTESFGGQGRYYAQQDCTIPATQANGFSLGASTTTTQVLNWSNNGNPNGVIILVKQGSAPTDPTISTTYTADATNTFGNNTAGFSTAAGSYVIYKGSATTVNVQGLSPNLVYFYKIYTYTAATNCYNLTSPISGSFTTANGPMTYAASTVTQSSVATLTQGASNQQIVQMQVNTGTGTLPPLTLTSLNFNTNGSTLTATLANDITAARIYYNTTNTISGATQFGSDITTFPGGSTAITVAGSQVLQPSSNNYFFVLYDVNIGATVGNLLDAEITSITYTNGTPTTVTPTPTTAPAGTRAITSVGTFACTYTGSSQAITYTSIIGTGGTTTVASGSIDDVNYPSQTLPFTFNFNDIDYTSFGISSNGYIWFGSGLPSTTNYTPIASNTNLGGSGTISGVVAAAGMDLINHAYLSSAPTPTQITTKVTGVAPNRVMTIQWSGFVAFDVSLFYSCSFLFNDESRMDFQIQLFESNPGGANSNKIEMCYRNQSPFCVNDPYSMQVGLRGATNADFATRANSGNMTSTSTTLGGTAATAIALGTAYINGTNVGVRFVQNISKPLVSGSATNICPAVTTLLTGTAANPVSPTYQWYKNGLPIALATSNTYAAPTTGNYLVVAANGACGKVSAPLAVTISGCNSITTSNVAATNCAGAAISVNFTAVGTYTVGNVYTAQLSNASGSFASPVTIGTLSSTSNGALTINAGPGIIPAATPAGVGYKIRVISSNPAITGSENTPFEVLDPAPIISVTNPAAGCAPGTVNITAPGVVTVTNGTSIASITYWNNVGATIAYGGNPLAVAVASVIYVKYTNSCGSDIKPITVTFSNPVIGTNSKTNPSTCAGSNGTITLNGLAASTSYNVVYQKNGPPNVNAGSIVTNGSGSLTITGLGDGAYDNIVVTLAGCASTPAYPTSGFIALNDPAAPTVSSNSFINPTTCSSTDGSIQLNGLLASTTYAVIYDKNTVTQSSSNITTDGSGALIITGLGDGNYDNIVVSLLGCNSSPTPAVGVIALVPPASPAISSSTPLNPTTCSGSNGSIDLAGLANSTAYTVTYMKNASPVSAGSISSNGSGVLTVGGLTQGTYTNFVVTNALGCYSAPYPSSGSIILTDPAIPNISSFTANDPITCSGSNGSIALGGLSNTTTYTVTYKKNGGSTINAGSIVSNGSGVLTIPNLGSGDYDNIIVTVNNCSSNPYPVSGNITLIEPPIPGLATGIPAEVCGANVLLLGATGAGAGEDYKWYSTPAGASLEQTGGSSFGTPFISTTTNYYVTIYNTTSGCESTSRTLVVATIYAFPTAVVSGALTGCGSSLLSSSSSTAGSGTITNRQWKLNGANIALENGITYNAIANGNYSVEITNTNGCTLTSALSAVTIAPQPTAVAGGSTSTCENSTVTVSGASATNGTIQWIHNGNGSITNGTTLTPTYNCSPLDAGTTVTLTMLVTPGAPCSIVTATYTIDVRPRPVVTPASANLICGGAPFQQLDIVSPEASTDYKWAPASDLYLDNNFTIPYVLGTSATTVYAAPFTNITYNVTATNTITGCTTGATPVNVVVCANLTDAICNADAPAGLVNVTTTATFSLYDFSGSTFGGGASCAASLDKDIWRRAVVPANGEINVVTQVHNNATVNLNITSASAQIFTATNCSTAVVSVACDAGGAAANMAYTHASGLTPGSTVYIRIGRLSAPANNPTVSRYIRVAVTSGLIWTAAANDDFNNPANWHGGDASALTKPDATISAIIPSTVTKPKLYSNSVARGMNFITGAPYFVSPGMSLNAFTLSVKGDWMVGPSVNSALVLDCNGTVEFNGTVAQAIGGKTTFGNLTTNNSIAGVNLTNSTSVSCILTTTAGNLTSNGNLSLRSTLAATALVNPSAGTVIGNVNVERKIGATSGYHYLSSPVSGAFVNNTINGWRDDFTILPALDGIAFIPGNTYSQLPSVWEYNETDLNPNPAYGWISTTASDDPITQLKGFACVVSANTVVDVVGPLNNGTIAGGYSITKTAGTGIGEGLNAIGNPYASPISWNAFRALPANSSILSTSGYQAFISSGGYGGAYGSWDGSVGSPASVTDKIASSQGIMVTALATGTINAANAVRLTSALDVNPTFFNGYNSVPDLMRFEIQGNGHSNETAIYFDPTGNDTYNVNRDARLIYTPVNGVPNIYSNISNTPLNINVMGKLDLDKVVPLGVKIQTAGTYNLVATDMTSFAPSVIAYLEDTQAGTMTNLRTNPSYIVSLPVGEINNRFFIHFHPAVELNAVNESCAGNDGKLVINYPAANTVNVVIKDENGNVINTQNNLTGTVTVNNLAAGNYVAEMTFGIAPNIYSTSDYFTVSGGNAVYANLSASANTVDMAANTTVNFTATAQGASSFNWNFGDGTVLTNGPANVSHTFAQVGTYNVTFEASNGICTTVATTTVEATNATGLTAIANSNLQVVGVGSKVTVRFGNKMEGTGNIEVINMLGGVVAHLDNVSMKGTREIDMSSVAAGQYMVKITHNNKLYIEKVYLSRQ